MRKRVFVVHGWGGYPEEGWFPWLKKELEQEDFEVFVPAMPNTDEPKIEEWIPHLANLISEPDKNTYLLGHSIGCLAILRYIEKLDKKIKIGGVILVAPWIYLDKKTMEEEGERGEAIARPWTETPIDWNKVKSHTKNFVGILSDNDPYVPLMNKELFEKKLGIEIIIEHNKSHFSGGDGINKLQSALESVLKFR